MSTIIKARASGGNTDRVAYNLNDISHEVDRYLEQAKAEADKIVQQAHQNADQVRAQAEQEGKRAAMAAMQDAIGEEMKTLAPALDQVIEDLGRAKQDWLAHWETRAVHLATAIAEKILRRELEKSPEITLDLVQDALRLTEGSTDLKILMSPKDVETLGGQVKQLTENMSRIASAEVVADDRILPGGCRIETKRGAVDNTFAAQLARIEEELS